MFIYKITNRANGKVYIGQSRNKNPSTRLKNGHIDKLNAGTHKNKMMQSDWNKFGSENFEFSILHRDVETFERLDEIEIYLIATLQTQDPSKGYNKAAGGVYRMHNLIGWNKGLPKEMQPRFGKKLSAEARERLDKRLKTMERKPKKPKPKKHSFPKQKRIAWNKGLPKEKQSRYGKKHSNVTKQKMSLAAQKRELTEQHREKCRLVGRIMCREVICITTGHRYSSITEAALDMNTKRTRISEVLSGKKKAWKGLVFAYGV